MQISQIEQAKYILTALQGDFQAFQWRNHGGYDLDAQYIWWTTENALPVGELALNFGRIKDDVIDEALYANRGETDPAVKQELAETVNKQFGEQCYNLWLFWTVWGLPHTPAVMDVGSVHAPRRLHPEPRHWRHVQRSARSGSTPTRSETHSKREVTA